MAWYDKENEFRKPGKEATPVNIHESAEDYLEKILMLQEQKGSVRSIDIAVATVSYTHLTLPTILRV